MIDQPTTAACAFGDLACPCQDGDVCHYVDDPLSETLAMTPPTTAAGQFHEDHERDMADPEYAEGFREATAEVTTTAARHCGCCGQPVSWWRLLCDVCKRRGCLDAR